MSDVVDIDPLDDQGLPQVSFTDEGVVEEWADAG